MSTQLNPHLSFRDNAREAMEFYKTALGGELELHTYEEYHASQDPSEDNKIMHSVLKTQDGHVLMAADTPNSIDLTPGTNFGLSLSGTDSEKLTSYFEKLSAGGTIIMPLNKAAWGDTFGMFSDKFGVRWMVNISSGAPMQKPAE